MSVLAKRKFGNTDLEVSIIGLGAGQVGRATLDEAEAGGLLNGALDAGINLIDTARGYGLSEERIGRHLAHRRQAFILSTKVGYDVPGEENWTYGAVQGGIERALRVMKTDVIDICHLHSCDLAVLERGEVIRALEDARQAGKIRYAAYSGENDALGFAAASGRFQSLQASVNLCDQRIIRAYLPDIDKAGLGFIAKRPVANNFWQFVDRPVGKYAETYWLRARKMGLDPAGLDWQAFALRFSAFTPGVDACITGTSNLEHLLENIAIVAHGPLPEAVVDNVRAAFVRNDEDWAGQV